MRRTDVRSIETQRRLLEAAGEVFAEHGFHHATIQEICRRAGANVAAVHYHFSDKEQLYRAVIDYAERCDKESHPLDGEERAGASAEERLRARVQTFLLRLLDEGRPAWHGKLMAREMVEPTAVLDDIVRERVRATHERFGAIVRELLGPQASADAARLCVHSIIGQCVYYRHSRPIITRLFPDLPLGRQEVAPLAEHITGFSLAGIRQLAAAAGVRTEPRRVRAAVRRRA